MKQLSFLFAGDIMAHMNQINAAKVETRKTENIFARFRHTLKGANLSEEYDFRRNFQHILSHIQSVDASVCNLETTIAGGAPSGYPRFNTPAAIADAIAWAGFTCVATANNHAFDSDKIGMIKTRKTLEQRYLKVMGTRKTPNEKAYVILNVKGVKVALLNYTYETAGKDGKRTLNNRPMDKRSKVLLNSFCFESIEEDLQAVELEIASARADGAQIVLVYYHWGNEYERYSNVFQKYVAWRTAHMGVDAIIGSHAHVMQELGEITVSDGTRKKRVPVFYGLGNYIWGAPPIYERETVLNNILAMLTVLYDEETGGVQVTPSYVPLYIAQKDNLFETIDMQALPMEDYASFEKRFGISAEKVLSQICETVENRVHPVTPELYFERIFRMCTGERASVLEGFLPDKKYVEFRSEDAIIASVMQNGYVIGNSPGYVGMTAVDADGGETAFLVQILPGEQSEFPLVVNEQNSVRDLYRLFDFVTGENYGLGEGIRLRKSSAQAWRIMQLAAREEGIYLKIVHAFRSKKDQVIRRYNYAKLYGDAAARRRYHRFGCTEHHLGTALDVAGGVYNGVVTPKADAFQWVQQNCGKFGFVWRRFTAKVENVAYIHLRYLGEQKLVELLNEKNITIEEYLTHYEEYKTE